MIIRSYYWIYRAGASGGLIYSNIDHLNDVALLVHWHGRAGYMFCSIAIDVYANGSRDGEGTKREAE
uniref:Uncharacterized protein n=1 Tax=Trichogramma kaykai TaxID=54128 RepID=A0ABD2XCK4_9HYME